MAAPNPNDSAEQIAAKLQQLNVNAPSFVPNAKAKPFVPSWMNKKTDAAPAGSAPAKVLSLGGSSNPAPAKVLSLGGSSNPAPAKVLSLGTPTEAPAPAASEPAPEAKAQPPAPKKEAAAAPAPAPAAPEVIPEEDNEFVKEFLNENYKEHLNVIFMGHVDAGKSTMGGNLLFLTGMVDKRTMEKYEKEAKEAGRESWYLSWALDLDKEERAKGKTVECGRAYFETETRRYTILDAPGHKNYVPSMIGGASQADIGVLVISARKGEFETGFERGGQTREHAILAKTNGVNKLVVVINKMDDPTVGWSKERYDDILGKLTPFLKGVGYNTKTDVEFIPVSGFTGANLKDRVGSDACPWFTGPSLLEFLDNTKTLDRKTNAPFMMPITTKMKELGTVVAGKIESGAVKKGQTLLVMPNSVKVEVSAIWCEEEEVEIAVCGDNIRMRIKGIEEEDVMPGFVVCSRSKPIKTSTQFEAQIAVYEHKNIICAGYQAVLHLHTAIEEVSIVSLLHLIDKKTGRKSKRPPPFVKQGQKVICRFETSGVICMESFEDYPQLGRFTLRDEGKTIAIGKITKVIDNANAAI